MAPKKTERMYRTRVLAVLLALSVIGTVAALAHHELQQGQMRDRLLLAADLKLLSQRVTTAALEAASGRPEGFGRIESLRAEFDEKQQDLRNGSGRFGPVSAEIEPPLSEVERLWAVTRDDLSRIAEGREAIDSINELTAEIAAVSPDLAQRSDEVARRVAALDLSGNQVYLASRQLMLIQRIGSSLTEVLGGGALAASAIDRFRRDAILYGRVLLGLRDGFDPLGVEAVEDTDVQEQLDLIAQDFERLSRSVDGIVELSSLVFGIDAAATAVETRSMDMLAATTSLEEQISQQANQLRIFAYLGFGFAALALLLLILIGVYAYRDTRRSLEATERQNARNQQAILRLLDEVMSLAEGDLTVNATVGEDFTGAIADSLNYAIASLRELVITINTIGLNVAGVARRSQDEVLAVSVRSEAQAQSILQANTAIGEVARAVEQVAVDANRSNEVALRSVTKAGAGADTVRRTIDGMNSIREQIQETAKRIKRLGESSQEVGDIIGLINDIAEQTNVLALNAAIQASAAGEAGRGFAVVADEVQRLAERSASATRQVEGLVKAIQADTNEAIYSMERSTTNVVEGAELAQAAGEALTEIETESQTLAELIQRMSRAATEQSERTRSVSIDMDEIRSLTVETTSATRVSAASIGDLVALSSDLERSVSGFRLPPDRIGDSHSAPRPDAPSDGEMSSRVDGFDTPPGSGRRPDRRLDR